MTTRQPEKSNRYQRVGQGLRLVLYLALLVSAAVTLFGMPLIQARVEAAQLDAIWLLAPSMAFGLFIVCYVADRLWLLRYRRYPASRAMLQIVLAGVFLLVLLPSSFREYRSVLLNKPAAETLVSLMHHRDERVRAIACELAAHRPTAEVYFEGLSQALVDPSTHVQKAAQTALHSLIGEPISTGAQGQQQVQQYLQRPVQPESKNSRNAGSTAMPLPTAPTQQDASFEDRTAVSDDNN